MEGYAPINLQAYSGIDGATYAPVTLSLLMTKESSEIYESYLKRGYKRIDVTIVTGIVISLVCNMNLLTWNTKTVSVSI